MWVAVPLEVLCMAGWLQGEEERCLVVAGWMWW